MNRWAEFHDSAISHVTESFGVLHMSFDHAYIHSSLGRPGIDDGEGHSQSAELTFEDAVCEGIPSGCTGELSDGTIWVNGVPHTNGLPVPFHCEGNIKAEFIFCTAAACDFQRVPLAVPASNDARWVNRLAQGGAA